MSKIDLTGLNKASVLIVLHSASKLQGKGFLQTGSEPITQEKAEALLEQRTYFDYLEGRVMKVDLSGDEFDPYLYDRDNGQGAAEHAVAQLRKT